MKMIKIILILAFICPTTISLAHDNHKHRPSGEKQWWVEEFQEPYSDYYEHDEYDRSKPYDNYEKRHPKQQRNKTKNKRRKIVQSGWDINPQKAKQASNCYRYTLTSHGGKASARITSISGKNYIQTQGQKSGYVCFQGEPTLELGKLGDPNIKVKFKLQGKGSYSFARGDKGAKRKNNWYRSYWGL